MIAGDVFITPHAVRQFQARVPDYRNATYEQALGVIIRALRDDAQSVRPTRNQKGLCVRVRGSVNFRAIILPSDGKPAVVTILRSGK